MADELFNVIFRGDIVPGRDVADVKVRFAQLFKTDPAKVEHFFSGKAVVLKPNCDNATAEKFKAALAQAGAVVEIRSASPQPAVQAAPASAPAPVPPSAVTSVPATPAPSPRSVAAPPANPWSLAPEGSDLVRPDEVDRPEPVNVDISQLSMVKRNPFSTDAEEPLEADHSVPPPALDLSAFKVGEVGETLVAFKEFVPRELDLSELSLDAPGADVLRADERQTFVPLDVDTSGMDIAPPGGDLGQIKPPPAPPAPSTDHISVLK